jgi:hypothetical protein
MERAAMRKRIRSIVRAEASILADKLLNEIEAEADAEFDRRLEAGEPLVLIEYEGWLMEKAQERFRPVLEAGVEQ